MNRPSLSDPVSVNREISALFVKTKAIFFREAGCVIHLASTQFHPNEMPQYKEALIRKLYFNARYQTWLAKTAKNSL